MTDILYYYWATALTGGGDGALDSFDGGDLLDGTPSITADKTAGLVYFHVLDATSGLDESSPDVIKPDDNAGDKRWVLINVYGAAEAFLGLTDTPVTFTGQGGKFVKVNIAESSLEFVDYAYVNHATSHTDGTDDIQNATAAQKGLATATQITKLDGIEVLADVTATHETSHADVLVDGDFASGGLMKTDGAGTYSVVTDTLHTQGTDTALGVVTEKNPPIDADKAVYRDSTSGDALVTSTWTQIKAFLKTYFDTLYNKYVHPNHSGDVTSVADGATTIANDAVTYAKMQNVSATDKVLGRSTAGAGDVEEIACTSAGRALIDDANNTAQRETLGLVIGTDVQAYSDYLKQIAETSPLNGDILIGKSIDGSWNQVAGVFDDATSHKLKHESGGLEADVSAYDGLVKISGGATSEVADTLHTQNTDTALGTMAADINMDSSYQITNLQAPAAAGEAIRQTATITEAALETAIGNDHSQNTDTGTTSQTFQLQSGSGGAKVKNNSDVLEARNSADDAYADFRAADGRLTSLTLNGDAIGSATATGSATAFRASVVDGTAFIDQDDEDIGAVLAADVDQYIELTDGNGKKVNGWIKAQGSGETLSDEIG